MSIAFESHFWSFDENRFNYSDGDLSTHIYHPKQSAKLGSNIFRDYRQKWAEKRQEKQWRLPKTNKLRESLVEMNKLMNNYSILSMVTSLEETLMLLADGTLVAMTLKGCDPDWVKLYKNVIPGLGSNEQVLSSAGSEDAIVSILSKSRLAIISDFERIATRPPQAELVNVPSMPDNACVQTRGNYSAIYWSERSEEGSAMGQLLILLHRGGRGVEINTRVRFDSLIQTIVFSTTKPNLMWCIEIPDPQKPSTLKLTQFYVKEKGLKVFDSDDEFIVELSSSVITSQFSPNEEKILFGCSDNTLVILDTKTKSVECVQTTVRPVFLSWHPLNHFFIVTSRIGQAALFDVGLTQLEFVPIRENAEFDKTEKLSIDKFYRPFTFVERLEWLSPTQCVIAAKSSPLVLLNFPFGVFAQGALGLVKEHVRLKRYQAAIKVLYSINWNTQASVAYAALTTILDALLVLPLNYNRETYIENCLAAFYNPTR